MPFPQSEVCQFCNSFGPIESVTFNNQAAQACVNFVEQQAAIDLMEAVTVSLRAETDFDFACVRDPAVGRPQGCKATLGWVRRASPGAQHSCLTLTLT